MVGGSVVVGGGRRIIKGGGGGGGAFHGLKRCKIKVIWLRARSAVFRAENSQWWTKTHTRLT